MQASADTLLPYLVGPYSGLVISLIACIVLYRMLQKEQARTDRAITQNDAVTGLLRDIVGRLDRQDREDQIRREYERDVERGSSP